MIPSPLDESPRRSSLGLQIAGSDAVSLGAHRILPISIALGSLVLRSSA